MNQREFPVSIIKTACHNYIQERIDLLKAAQEPSIQKEMKGNWFKKPCTREKAIETLYGDLWSDCSMAKLNFDYHSQTIKELLSLCKDVGYNSSSTVLIDSQTAYILRNHL